MSVPTDTSPAVSQVTGHEPVLITAAGKTPVAAALEAWDAIRAGHQWRYADRPAAQYRRRVEAQLAEYRRVEAQAETEWFRRTREAACGALPLDEYEARLARDYLA